MKLSEIVASSGLENACFYGVTVDEPSFSPPAGLREIGLLWPLEGEGLDEMDVAIAFGMAGVHVIIELPAEREQVDAPMFVSLAANIGASLSVLPPKTGADAQAFDRWNARVQAFTAEYLKSSIFAKHLFPVTSYLEYMFREVYGDDLSGFAPKDGYILDAYVSRVSLEQSDAMKALIRSGVYEQFGGAEAFAAFAAAVAAKVSDTMEANFRQSVASSSQPAPDQSN